MFFVLNSNLMLFSKLNFLTHHSFFYYPSPQCIFFFFFKGSVYVHVFIGSSYREADTWAKLPYFCTDKHPMSTHLGDCA